MNTGQIISGAAHVGLIGWLIVGGSFQSEPLPFEVTEVSVISTDAFEALMSAGPAPAAPTEVALPEEPEVIPDPVVTPEPDTDVTSDQPAPAPAPEPETLPEPPAPEPEPEVADEAPSLPTPDVPQIDAPEVADTPVPEASDRVAPDVVEAPDPDATPDVVEQEAVTNDEGGETQAEEQEATAPEEASDQIVTEAEEPSGAPQSSLRPPSRRPTPPARTAETAPAAQTEPQPAAQPEDTSDAVNDALAGILGGGEDEVVPQGPPLSNGEKEALRVAVSSCWNVGSLSTEALGTTVVVGVDMEQNGKPVVASIRMLSSSGGSQSAANQAFEAARRAIIRCTRDGYSLPAEKYGQWKEIEMTFNPERMRIK